MTRELVGAAFQLGMIRDGNFMAGDTLPQQYGSSWYLSRKEIENFSPSRKDGIDLRKESELRISYSTFLKDFGMRLGLPQVTIATAIIFCHRFYLHQSHARNDWQTVATVCMFLASKVEDTPLSLEKVIILSYETIYKKDPATARRIHQKDVFEKQKALVLIAERLLLSTIRFDFNIQHPYRPLLHALKKFGMTEKDVRQVAWNFVNDSLRTTLCLQYKPHYIAAGSLFLAAKLHNVKLPSERGYVWWHEFDVTPQQLHAAIQEMTEILGYKRKPVVACALVKPTRTSLVAKVEESSSPDSCVLNRPGSSRSSSSQCSDGDGARQKPADIIIPRTTRKLDLDVDPASVAGTTEVQSQAIDSESPDSVVEDSGGSVEGVDQVRIKLEQVADIADCHKSGECVVETWMKPEDNGSIVSCQGSGEGVDEARTGPEQEPSTEDSQGSGEGIDQMRMNPEQVADVISCRVPGEGAEHATTPEQVAHADGYLGSGEGMDQSRMKPEQIAAIVSCNGHDEGADQTRTPEQVAHREGCQGYAVGVDQTPSYLEQVPVADLPRIKPEQVATIEDYEGSGEDLDQTRIKPEKVTGGLSRIDMDRIIALVKRRKRARESPSYSEQAVAADLPRIKPEQIATVNDCQGSGEILEQTRTKPEKVTDGFGIDADRIKAMVKRRKREREIISRKEAMDEYSEDTLIEIAIETGIEL